MPTVHHLQRSQSERIVWLCEELQIPYDLKLYKRDPLLAPAELKALTPMGSAPVLTDGSLTLAESGAIVEYIIHTYGGGRLAVAPGTSNYSDYLYWFHFANGNLQANVSRTMWFRNANLPDDNPVKQRAEARLETTLKVVESRLGQTKWLAGNELTAADIMSVFSLTTMRVFIPFDLSNYPNILGYLKRVGERKAYQEAMAKGEPGFEPALGASSPPTFAAMKF